MVFCKLALRLIFHLAKNVDSSGLLANYNQVWVETYIGFIKNKLKARSSAAESMSQSAKFLDSFNLF